MNDRDALCLVLNRLNADVGGLFNLVEKHNSECEEDDQRLWPFWAFSRMLFPVAEAVGYLVYGKGNSWDLIEILENEFESVRTGYRGKAALIVLLFRHSLIHTDELRILCQSDYEFAFKSVVTDILHLTFKKNCSGIFYIY